MMCTSMPLLGLRAGARSVLFDTQKDFLAFKAFLAGLQVPADTCCMRSRRSGQYVNTILCHIPACGQNAAWALQGARGL